MNYICKCKKTNFLKKEYTYWEDRQVTTDELDIINFLKKSHLCYDLTRSIRHGSGRFSTLLFLKKKHKMLPGLGLTLLRKKTGKMKQHTHTTINFQLPHRRQGPCLRDKN